MAPYCHYNVDHALCDAHHLRELNAVGIGWDQGWANDLASLLVEAKHTVEHARASGKDHLDTATLHSIRVRYGQLVGNGLAANPQPEMGAVGLREGGLHPPRAPRRATG